ncbi:MAG: hypothetical protein ACREAM_21520 [Blastocatellia bacterium]
MASSIYGTPRSTQDVDFVAELKEEQIVALVAALEAEFYIDSAVVRRAVRSRRSFNVIHLDTMYKADIFVLGADRHAQEEKQRRRIERLGPGPDAPTAYFCSAEDVVLQKLLWFRKGAGVSERQWNDLLSVLKVQANALDYDYLNRWATELGVADLLVRAFDDAGIAFSTTDP